MISIRRNTFETNSSSSHTLAITNGEYEQYDDSIFEQEFVIKSYATSNKMPGAYFITPQEKLEYLYTVWLQANGYFDGIETFPNYYPDFLDLLKSIFPKATFIDNRPLGKDGKKECVYAFEDADFLFENWGDPGEIQPFIDDLQLFKEFFKYGVIFFGDRDADWDDFESDYYRREDLKNNASFYIDFAG